MTTRKKILFPRSDIPNRAPTLNEIDFGEIAINTHDGKAFIKRQANGEVTIESIGTEQVDNVYYVSKSGDYGNDGRSLMNSFKTVDSAVATVLAKQGFKFNEEICERDLNLIMDAVRYDMVLNTNYNSVTAGLAYRRGNAIKVTTEQKYQTRRSINEERVGMISAPEIVASSTATSRIVSGFDNVIDIFYDKPAEDLYYTDPPIEVNTDANAAANAIQANKVAIQDAIIQHVNDGNVGAYDVAKCSRDVGLILDAVSRDLILGTNYNTTTAGWAYKRANSAYVLSNQNDATVAGINFARDYILALTEVTSDTQVTDLFLNVTNVIIGVQTTYPSIDYPDTAGSTYQTADRITASAIVQTNRQTLIDDTTEYINDNYTGIGATCRRDLGLILDAVQKDLILGTDFWTITAANAYLNANSAYVLSDQSAVTVALVNYARDLIKALAGITSDSIIDTLFLRITNVLDGTTTTVQPVTTYPIVGTYASETTPNRESQKATIVAERTTLIDDTISYISTNYGALVYDQAKCERDTGYIIDALVADLTYGGNSASRTAALNYFEGAVSQLPVDQQAPTIAAFTDLRDRIKALTDVTEDARIDTLIAIINDAITANNVSGVPAEVEISTAGLTTTEYDLIESNETSIIDSTIEYGRENYSFYDQDACERDVGYILDGLSHDLKYGGNTALRTNAEAYLVGTTLQLGSDEITATVAAYNDLKTRLNNSITTAPEQSIKDDFLQEIIDVITAGNTSTLDAEVEVETGGLNTTEFDAIKAAISEAQSATIDYVNENWASSLSGYDAVKCARDVGLILDAVRRDLILGSDYWTITAGNAYFRANSAYVLSNQSDETVSAVNFARDQIKAIAGITSDATLDLLFKRVTDCIDGTFITPQDTLIAPLIGDYATVARVLQYTAIATNRSNLVDNLITYLDTTYPTFTYDETSCRRDAGFLIDALNADLLYGGNTASRQAALAYFVGTTSQLGDGESTVTVLAFNYLSEQIQALGDVTEDSRIQSLVSIVTDVISAGNTDNLVSEVEISTAGLSTTEYDLIVANTLIIQNDVIDYVNDMNPVGNFDDEKCFRDTGLIIDAIALDLQNNTNYNSATAGLAYRRGNAEKVQSDQLSYTVDSINYLRDQIIASGINATSQEFVTARFKEITDLLTESTEYGAFDGDPLFYTGSGTENSDKRNAANALIVNRRSIQTQLITWIQNNYDTLEYDQDKCERDVGFITDALVHDILFDGTFAIDTNARSYWVGKDLNIEPGNANESLDGVADVWTNQLGSGEIAASVAAYNQLKIIINQYVNTVSEETRVSDLIDVINSSIQAVDGSGITVTLPSITGESGVFHVNRSTLQEQVVFYANSIFPTFSYDQATCRRDVGYILDALTYDLKYGGNSATYTNQRAYFSIFGNGYGDLLGQNELTATISAYGHLKTVIAGYISALNSANTTIVNNLLDIIINSIQQSSVGTYTLGEFFNGALIYQYNVPNGSPALEFPDLITLGYKVLFNELYVAHQIFNEEASQRLTIIRSSSAVANNQGTDSTIFVKSGDYIINNPIKLPPKTSIIGDALRSVTFRPNSVDSDFFWADNGVYIKEITFRDHQNGAACLAFDPRVDSPGAGPFITQSPYVQNCTSLTSSGIGLRIDGSKVSGLRSMVLDAFTQFNAGGTGVYLLNRGYAQLVSLFTVSTTTSVLTETGGQCSLTNSNSSFGDRGLVSTGGSPSLYNGSLHADYIQNDDVIRVNNIVTQDTADYTLNIGDYKKPNYNDAIKFDDENYYYTVIDVSDEILLDWASTNNSTEVENYAANKNTNAKYGSATHISQDDNYMIATSIDGNVNLGGDAEIFKRDIVGGVPQWNKTASLIPIPDFGISSADLNFGQVALLTSDASYAAVSAPGQINTTGGGSARSNGAIYMFRRASNGETWSQDAMISLDEVTDRDRFFGRSMDLSEDGLWMVASTDADIVSGGQGAAYVFSRTETESSTWTQKQRLTIPAGTGVSVTEPEVSLNNDGSDLIITWKGITSRIYYYQRNIDDVYILAQTIVPKSNILSAGTRNSKLRMSPNTTHFVYSDINSPRGYFTNVFTDSDQSALYQYAQKQKLDNVTFSNSPSTISTTDNDRWINFETDFPTNTTIEILGSSSNDGTYTITDRTATTLTVAEAFSATGADTEVQIYVPQSGVSEFFVFDQGQWLTEGIIESPKDAPSGFGYGFDIDINATGDLVTVGNSPFSTDIKNEVTVIERARSDWRRVSRLEPATPTNLVTQGDNDKFGGSGHSTSVGGLGNYIVIGAQERRENINDANTNYGSVFEYYSILDETGSYNITVAPPLNNNLDALQNVSFHQRSLITASGHTFEYVGSGTNMFTAIPQNGGVPKKEQEVIFDSADAATPNFGLVYFTATDELGDFRIGEDLTINREEGTITGVTFDRSLFAVLTPFILALEG